MNHARKPKGLVRHLKKVRGGPQQFIFEGFPTVKGDSVSITHDELSNLTVDTDWDDTYKEVIEMLVSSLKEEETSEFWTKLFYTLKGGEEDRSVTLKGKWCGDVYSAGTGLQYFSSRFVITSYVLDGVEKALPIFVESREIGVYSIQAAEPSYVNLDLTHKCWIRNFRKLTNELHNIAVERCALTEYFHRIEGTMPASNHLISGVGMSYNELEGPCKFITEDK